MNVRRSRPLRIQVAAVAVALLAAACGDDATSTTNPPQDTTTTTTTTLDVEGGIRVGLNGSIALGSFAFNYDETVPISRSEIYSTQSFGLYQAPDRLDCTVVQGIAGADGIDVVGTIRTITIGDRLWVGDGDQLTEVEANDPEGNFARNFCSNAWTATIDVAPDPDFGQPFTYNGIDVRYADLTQEGIPLTGIDSEVAFQKFEVWLAVDGFWPVAFNTEAVGPAPAMASRVGRTYGDDPADGALVTTRGALSRVNDPEIVVPTPDG